MKNPNKTLMFALLFLSKNYSVIPVGDNKRPLIQWKEFQKRRATADEINAWWLKYPDAQIGIVTGQISNLTVIDVESDGDFNLITDKTYTVKTGGGGRHYYFKYQKEFKNAVRVFPSVDIRSEGGYVIGAHSESQKGVYSELNTLEVSQMSEKTLKLLREAKQKSEKVLPWYATSKESSYPKISPDNLEYQGSSEGSRNDSMTKFAGTIHAKLHPSLWPTIGWQMFEGANHKNLPPLPNRELNTIWNSIQEKEKTSNPNGRDYSTVVSGNKTWGPAPEETAGEYAEDESEDIVDHSADESQEAEGGEEEVDPKETLHVSKVAKIQKIDSEHTYPLNMKPFDEALLGGFSAGELVVVAGQSGHGKRLHVDTPILTPDGWKKNKDIKVGDKIIGCDGKTTNVIGAHPIGTGLSYKIEFNDKTTVIADGDHLWTVQSSRQRRTSKNWMTLTTKEILEKGILESSSKSSFRWFLPIVSPIKFGKKKLIIKPYTLGVLLANGSFSSSLVNITTNDEEIAEKMISESKDDISISEYICKSYLTRRWTFKKLHPILKNIGLDKIKSRKKFIPKEYLFSSVEDRLSLLRGLMDCDGFVKKNKRAEYSSTSIYLAKGVASLVRSLGGIATIRKENRKHDYNGYVVTIWTPMNPFSLERKAKNYCPSQWFKAIKRIEPFVNCEMRCLSVDNKDGLYVIEDFTVTHNTTLIQDWSVTLSSGGQEKKGKLPSLWFSYEVLAKPLWKSFQTMGASHNTPIYMPRFNETGEIAWVTDVILGAIKKWDIKVVCIDHLGFLRPPRGNYSNAADAITNTVRALKQMAIKHGLIILLPVHVRKTLSKIPDLNDIQSSLGIAQEADTVFFINREKDEMGLSTNQARVSLIKNRKTGISVNATFDFQFGRFYYNAENEKKSDGETSDALTALKEFDEWSKKEKE